MSGAQARFLFGVELECQTWRSDGGDREAVRRASLAFLREVSRLAPSLPADVGCFLPYGKVLIDCDHVELATCEVDSPEALVQVLEAKQALATAACRALKAKGTPLRLANNNHAGFLTPQAPTWGSHESFAVEKDPARLGDVALPFLVTRIYAGAGGVIHPSGAYSAGVRPYLMRTASGGDTTRQRAIHSTSRREPLGGERVGMHRYHLIVGDGKRCQYGVALTAGATALALKAMVHDPSLPARVARVLRRPIGLSWIRTIRAFHRLAAPGRAPRVRREVVAVQRVYLDAARRFADRLVDRPAWVPRTLQRWEETLRAFDRNDLEWLRERLDPFAKHELLSTWLAERGNSWAEVRGDDALFAELLLLDHSWHEFTDEDSAFARWERSGLLDHRVVETVAPGAETEPWIPDVATRARVRARFLVEHAGERRHLVAWTRVVDRRTGDILPLRDPFARAFEATIKGTDERRPPSMTRFLARMRAMQASESDDCLF